MHKSRLGAIVIDCRSDDIDREAAFWTEALGLSLAPGSDDRYRALVGPDDEVKVLLQKVEHESRVHLDIESDDIAAEVARLEKLGAKPVGEVKRWVVMEAPSGHRFCVVRPQRKDFAARARAWNDA
ncbi:VOC family protein [Oceanibacterium hippocampi]|uniref:Glyoxalase-like domain protein n=1 Tax=Oceanibacterium hippocampi TaxID=745714 RepID=A0A1Y5T0L4_9PROT|nr:VOC family protein [Oceanibacterium hippocampi]SLN49282.1 Glyoxalase-like domain protein [Oceanibacterium hippocampi]